MYKFTSKVLMFSDSKGGEALIKSSRTQLNGVAEVYAGSISGGDLLVAAEGAEPQPLKNPLTGTVVVAAPKAALSDDLKAAVSAVWEDANLPAPAFVAVSAKNLTPVVVALSAGLNHRLQVTAQRNVDLLNQVAVLRERCEDMSVVTESLRKVLNFESSDTHKMIYELQDTGNMITLPAGGTAYQRLPITILPSLIGGVSFTAASQDEGGQLQAELYSIELDKVLQSNSFDLPKKRSMIFLAPENDISPNTKMVELVLRNTGSSDIKLRGALQETPEEQFRHGSDAVDPNAPAESLMLNLWSQGPRGSELHGVGSRKFQVTAWDKWRNHAERGTPGFEERKWLEKRGQNSLLVHPLPKTFAVAICPITRKTRPYYGLQLNVKLPDKAKAAVDTRFVVSKKKLAFKTPKDVAEFSSQFAGDNADELYRSDWMSVAPGTTFDVTMQWATPTEDCFMYVINTTNGRSQVAAIFTVSDLKLIENASDF